MYRILRNTHLFLGLFCCMFLLMYGVSSVQMAHNSWFKLQPTVTTSEWTLTPNATDARPVARELMDRYDLRGDLGQILKPGGRLTFNLTRPGNIYQVDYAIETGATKVRHNVAGFMGMLNRIHHVAGLQHEDMVMMLWGILAAIVSAALFAIGISGIYLWFKIHKERAVGVVLLALSLGYSLTLMILLRNA